MGLQRTHFPLGSQSLRANLIPRITKLLSSQRFSAIYPKYALGLNTTGPELGLGISNASESRYQAWTLGRDLSIHLHSYLAEFIQPQTWSDLAFITVAKGPGSFVGTRIGVVTARTLAQQLNIPLFAVSNLEILAWSKVPLSAGSGTRIAVEMPARSGEVFAAIYQVTPSEEITPVLPETTLTLEKWQHLLNQQPTTVVRVKDKLLTKVACQILLEVADQYWQRGDRPTWSEVLPFYG